MTLVSTVSRATAAGNGVSTSFSFSPMVIAAPEDLVVTRIAPDDTETVLTLGVHFSIDIPPNGYIDEMSLHLGALYTADFTPPAAPY